MEKEIKKIGKKRKLKQKQGKNEGIKKKRKTNHKKYREEKFFV